MSNITEEDVMKYCYSRNLMLVTKESLEYTHRPIVIETMNKKAIPIEFIKAFKEKVRDVTNGKAVIEWLLENWEKENDNKYTL